MVHWYALVGDCVSRDFFFLNPAKPYASVTTGRNTKALFFSRVPVLLPWICFSQVQRNLISLDLDWTGFEAPQTPADAHDARPLPSPETR